MERPERMNPSLATIAAMRAADRPSTRDALTRLKGSVLRFDEPLAPVDEAWDSSRQRIPSRRA